MTTKHVIWVLTTTWLLAGLLPLHAQIKTEAPKTTTTVAADTTRIVEIINSNQLRFKKPNDTTDLQILVGNVKLKQGNSLFYCDSCVIDNVHKVFQAYGHVHINDSDTTDIYSDYLRYLMQQKLAYFNGNVKLTDGHGTLTTPDMNYDMVTKVGTYNNGGKVVNKKSVLTSQEGIYYADLRDVYFKKNVVLKDPAYDLTADSLLYSTAFETVRFITKTIIIDSAKRMITTSDGYYDLKNGKAEFGKRPLVRDGKTTIVGNRIAFNDSTGISEAEGNAVVVDSANQTAIIANKIFRNRKTEAILATEKPLMIIKQEADSIYVTADTLFSARLTDLFSSPASFKIDSAVKKDSIKSSAATRQDSSLHKDSSLNRRAVAAIDSSARDLMSIKIDSLYPSVTDTASKIPSVAAIDSIMKARPDKSDTALSKIAIIKSNPVPAPDSVKKEMVVKTDTVQRLKKGVRAARALPGTDTTAKKTEVSKKDLKTKPKMALATEPPKDTTHEELRLTSAGTINMKENDSTNRYFEGFRHVRIYSDSMQAVGDSMFYSFQDSVFRLFDDPVVWAKESQITGDTIYMFTKSKKPDRLKVWNNSLLVNKLEKEAYNQVKSSRMDAYFVQGEIDSVRARGSAECIYYLQDKDSAYTGINQSQSDIMDVYFKQKEIQRVVFRSQVKGTLWPIRQKNPAEMRLQSFKWLEVRRPKTKYDLME
jgi:lipopolysaccharide export system protein LptA